MGIGTVVERVLRINMKDEEFIVSAYNYYVWEDKRLSWNPDDFGGIKATRVYPDLVWTPGVILYNTRDGQFTSSTKVKIILHKSGRVNWLPPALFRTTCSINVRLFPFDQQTCRLIFRSTDYG